MKRIAINGFGRIGRTVLRIIQNCPDVEIIAINDLADINTMSYLLKYDSIHGRFPGTVEVNNDGLYVNGRFIKVISESRPYLLPWRELEIDVVLESTGVFLDRESLAMHLTAGAKKVLVTTPCAKNDVDATICYGINTDVYHNEMRIISTASCTTNCIAPIAKIINDKFLLEKAFATTIHSYTNDQNIVDFAHKDVRRSRAAGLSMIPTSTGASKALSLVLPGLKLKLDAISIRVPIPNVSCVNFVALVGKKTNEEEVNLIFKYASKHLFDGILGYTEEPVVSIDINGTTESSIVDSGYTRVIGDNLIHILAWYDNEWGFGCRAVDILKLMAKMC